MDLVSGMTIGSISHDSKIGWLEVFSSLLLIENQHYAASHFDSCVFLVVINHFKTSETFFLRFFIPLTFADFKQNIVYARTL